MSRLMFRTSAFAVLAFGITSTAAVAQSSPEAGGHYEWRPAPQFGPRTWSSAPHRVWVPDSPRVATRDCAMMQSHATNCMSGMKGEPERSSAS